MALFILSCHDKPGALAVRMAARSAHLAYVAQTGRVRLGGPYLNATGEPIGSMLVVEADDLAGAEAFAAADPYAQAGLFAEVTITPWRVTVGGFAG